MDAKDFEFWERCVVAGMASLIQVVIHAETSNPNEHPATVAKRAFDYADAMLKESQKRTAGR